MIEKVTQTTDGIKDKTERIRPAQLTEKSYTTDRIMSIIEGKKRTPKSDQQ